MKGIILKSISSIFFWCVTAVSAKSCLEISPKGDVFVKAGEDIHIKCSLRMDMDNCFHNFSIKSISIHKGSTRIKPDNLTYFEETKTIVLPLRKVDFEDDGYYRCTYLGKRASSHTNIRVGEVPEAPKDIVCISDNFYTFRCSFKSSKTHIPTKTTMKFRLNQNNWTPFPISNCVNMTTTAGMCWLDSRTEKPSNFTFMPSAKYSILVETMNKLGKNSTQLEITNTGDIVKPAPLEIIDVAKKSSEILLYWKCPKALIHEQLTLFPMDFSIKITSKWHNQSLFIEKNSMAFSNMTIQDLKPFTSYIVKVQAKPSAAHGDKYWSDVSSVSFVTHSTVSTNTVNTTIGCYMWVDAAQIVLFWKNPARRYWNGNITGYKIVLEKYVPLQDQIWHLQIHHHCYIEEQSKEISGLRTSAVLATNIHQNVSYKAKINIKNTEGVSDSHSEVAITDWNTGNLLRPRWVLVEVSESSVEISWNIHPEYCKPVKAVTYYWCQVDSTRPFNNSYPSCVRSTDWVTFNISDGCGHKHEINTNRDHIKFAVSVNIGDQLSGGMVWENFRFSKHEVPEKPIYSISSGIGRQLKIHVLYGDYHLSKGGLPNNYSVEYIECMHKDDCSWEAAARQIFPVDFVNRIYIIDNLKPGTMYSVRISSINENGRSVYGETVRIKTEKDTFDNVAELIVVVSIVTVCSLVGCIIFCVRTKYKALKDEFHIKTPEDFYSKEKSHCSDECIPLPFDNSEGSSTVSVNNEEVVHNEIEELNIESASDSLTTNVNQSSSYIHVGDNNVLTVDHNEQGYVENSGSLMTTINTAKGAQDITYVKALHNSNDVMPVDREDNCALKSFIPKLTDQTSPLPVLTSVSETEIPSHHITSLTANYSSNREMHSDARKENDYVSHNFIPTLRDEILPIKALSTSDVSQNPPVDYGSLQRSLTDKVNINGYVSHTIAKTFLNQIPNIKEPNTVNVTEPCTINMTELSPPHTCYVHHTAADYSLNNGRLMDAVGADNYLSHDQMQILTNQINDLS